MKKVYRLAIAMTLIIFLCLFPNLVIAQFNLTPEEIAEETACKMKIGSPSSQDLLNAQKLASILRNQYTGWQNKLDNCPCTRKEAAEKKDLFEENTKTQCLVYYHPGGVFEYRSVKDRVKPFAASDPTAPILMPGQQCIYDDAGNLITHGPGAGTPDAYSPSITDNFDGVRGSKRLKSHTFWDVEPFNNGLTWREYQYTWTPNKGNSCSYTNRVKNSCQNMLIPPNFDPEAYLSSKTISQINLYSKPQYSSIPTHFGLGGDRISIVKKYNNWYYVRYRISGICGWVNQDFVRPRRLPPLIGFFIATFEDMVNSITAMREENPDLFKRAIDIINTSSNTIQTFKQVKEEIHKEQSKLNLDVNMGEDETNAIHTVNSNMFSGGLANGEVLPEEEKFQLMTLKAFIHVYRKFQP